MVRMAKCPCGQERPSSPDLPFFESTGEGSSAATVCAVCHYFKVAHEWDDSRVHPEPAVTGHLYAPHGAWEKDRFYCGHAGWD